MIRMGTAAACLCLGLAAAAMGAGKNLVVNGSFDHSGDKLFAWKYKFDLPGESWYYNNHEHVSVVDQDGAQRNVLALWGNEEILQVPGQGTKVESAAIPVQPGGRYRFTASARSTGPDCRILVEGYKWKPGIKPHDDPELHELRKCFRSTELYFSDVKAGTSGAVGKTWRKSSVTFPKEENSDIGKESFKQIQFLVIHIVAIKGSEGYLYVDDISLERVN